MGVAGGQDWIGPAGAEGLGEGFHALPVRLPQGRIARGGMIVENGEGAVKHAGIPLQPPGCFGLAGLGQAEEVNQQGQRRTGKARQDHSVQPAGQKRQAIEQGEAEEKSAQRCQRRQSGRQSFPPQGQPGQSQAAGQG